MGDRCYVQLFCRKEDAPRFEEMDFQHQENDSLPPGIVEMVDEERNCGTESGEGWPTDIPYTGSAGDGYEYDAREFACDGHTYSEVPTGKSGGYVIDWDAANDAPHWQHVNDVREYLAIEKRADEILGLKPQK